MGEVAAGEAGIMGGRRAGDVSQCGGWASNSSCWSPAAVPPEWASA